MRRSVSFLAASILFASSSALAQEDTTPPVLVDFSISPVVFDSGTGDVTFDWCASAQDDLSGLREISLVLKFPTGTGNRSVGRLGFTDNPLFGSGCGQFTIAQFHPYDTYPICLNLSDPIVNFHAYCNPLIETSLPLTNLCEFPDATACALVNRPEAGLPDADGDGVPDDADNCPDDPNADQADADLDLIGDTCDPFPDEGDHEKAQCFEDLAACESTPAFVDSDGDGEENSTDACPGTLIADVDAAGCSLAQFCTSIDASTSIGARICRNSDWRNDEPITGPDDCAVRKVRRGPTACVPAL